MIKSNPQINIVIPLYNEEEIYPTLIKRLNNVISSSEYTIEVILIDDGSKDNTRKLIENTCSTDKNYSGVILSRNHGHQLALSAGLSKVNCQIGAMIIDGDLQDPPELLDKFINYNKQGYEVVYAVRKKRKENFFKKISYYIFYRLLKKISEIDLPLDTGDFSFISRRAIDTLNSMPETSRYLRGMRTWIGFNQIGIEYERDKRAAGEPKYNFKMLMGLAYNGIFNFSTLPIKIITLLGGISVLFSLAYLGYVFYLRLFTSEIPSGFTALLFTIILFGGVQLISLGVLGEYIVRTFIQSKRRPLFLIDKHIKSKLYE